jgi:hypothetical protein
MDKEINVELREIPRQHVGFSAVEIGKAFEVTTQLVDNFVTYYQRKLLSPLSRF